MTEPQVATLDSIGASHVATFSHFANGPLIAITAENRIYELNGERFSPISTPDSMQITCAAFRSRNEGIAIGTRHGKSAVAEGSVIVWIILGFLVVLLGALVWGIIHTIRRKQWKILSAIGLFIVAIVVLLLHFVQFKSPTRTFAFESGTHYLDESGQPYNLIAETMDGGTHWRLGSLGTNFYLTDCAPVESGYLVTTYASPDHLDGDLWKVPTDSASAPGLFSPGRALWGIAECDSAIFAYGTDIIVWHTGNPWQKVSGEVFRTNMRLDTVTFLELSSNGGIVSLSANDGSNFWIVTRNHILKKYSKGSITTIPFVAGSWPTKIAVLSAENIAVLDNSGHLYHSGDGGTSWHIFSFPNSARVTAIEPINGTLCVGDARGNIFRVTFE